MSSTRLEPYLASDEELLLSFPAMKVTRGSDENDADNLNDLFKTLLTQQIIFLEQQTDVSFI
jgi:hypothetical protein